MIATRFPRLADRCNEQDESRTRPMPNDRVQLRPPRRHTRCLRRCVPKTQKLPLEKTLDLSACVIDVCSVNSVVKSVLTLSDFSQRCWLTDSTLPSGSLNHAT